MHLGGVEEKNILGGEYIWGRIYLGGEYHADLYSYLKKYNI